MNQPEFPTVFRGYDPVSVDQHVSALRQAAEAARQAAEAAQQEAASASLPQPPPPTALGAGVRART